MKGMEQGNHRERQGKRRKERARICPLVVINNHMVLYYEDGGRPYFDCDDMACLLESDFKDLTTCSTANLALADQVCYFGRIPL